MWSHIGFLCGRPRKYPRDPEQTAATLSVPHSPLNTQDRCVYTHKTSLHPCKVVPPSPLIETNRSISIQPGYRHLILVIVLTTGFLFCFWAKLDMSLFQVVTLCVRPLTSSLLSAWVWCICFTSALTESLSSNLSPAGQPTLRGACKRDSVPYVAEDPRGSFCCCPL